VGCLGHDLTVAQVVAALQRTDTGFFHDPSGLLAVLRRAASLRSAPTAERLSTLTAREREVLGLLAGGLDDAGIAASLVLSPNTVRTHIGRIMRKLGVHTRADAIRAALTVGSTGGVPLPDNIARITGPKLELG
jgi:DNA-binding NarL/FixJ family response regulator